MHQIRNEQDLASVKEDGYILAILFLIFYSRSKSIKAVLSNRFAEADKPASDYIYKT